MAALIAVAAFGAFAACGDDADTGVGEGSPTPTGGPRLETVPMASDNTAGGDDASFIGVAVITEGCPLLEIEGEGLAALQFPAGTRLLDDGITLEVPGDRAIVFTPGETVSVPGGLGDAERGIARGSDDLVTCIERSGATAVVFVSGEG